jgi:hypothetical protein
MILSASVSMAAEPVSVVIDELRCFHMPEVTGALEALHDEGFLVGKFQGIDPMSCWPLREPIRIHGIDFTRLCAGHEDPRVIQAHPDLYWLGPGLRRSTSIALLTGDKNAIALRKDFGSEELDIAPDDFFKDEIAVRCNPYP